MLLSLVTPCVNRTEFVQLLVAEAPDQHNDLSYPNQILMFAKRQWHDDLTCHVGPSSPLPRRETVRIRILFPILRQLACDGKLD
jgi:hypothetical protein